METLRIVWNTRSLKSSPETSTKPGEREARHVLFYQNYQLRVEVEEHQRQARYAPGRPVQESSQNYDLMMVQALSNLPRSTRRTHERQRKEGDSCDCIGSTKSFFYVDREIIYYKKSEHSFTLERGDQSSSRARPTRTCSRKLRNFKKVVHEQEVQQEQGLESMRMFEAQLRLQLHPEEQKEASIVNGGSPKETFESKRQAGKTLSRNPVTFQEGSIRSDISL